MIAPWTQSFLGTVSAMVDFVSLHECSSSALALILACGLCFFPVAVTIEIWKERELKQVWDYFAERCHLDSQTSMG